MLMNISFNAPLTDVPGTPKILPLYGGAEKPIEEMTAEEHEQAAEEVYRKVREAAFSRGLPVVIEKDGKVVRVYADGRVEAVA
jgi:hypothetical protein